MRRAEDAAENDEPDPEEEAISSRGEGGGDAPRDAPLPSPRFWGWWLDNKSPIVCAVYIDPYAAGGWLTEITVVDYSHIVLPFHVEQGSRSRVRQTGAGKVVEVGVGKSGK